MSDMDETLRILHQPMWKWKRTNPELTKFLNILPITEDGVIVLPWQTVIWGKADIYAVGTKDIVQAILLMPDACEKGNWCLEGLDLYLGDEFYWNETKWFSSKEALEKYYKELK